MIGKGLEGYVIVELLFYYSASLIPMALPLAVLLSSIMTFGNLGERYEMVAIKSAGISFWRSLYSMVILMIGLSIGAFFVSNILIPKANLKSLSLLYDIRSKKPSLLIPEGVFYNGIEGYSIKIGKKEKDKKTIRSVLIYDHSVGKGNANVLMADSGTMVMSEDKEFLFLTLYNGKRYEEANQSDKYYETYPHKTISFAEQQLIFDLSQFQLQRTDVELFKDNYHMLNTSQLEYVSDSMQGSIDGMKGKIRALLDPYIFMNDSIHSKFTPIPLTLGDTDIIAHFEGYSAGAITNSAMNNVRTAKGVLSFYAKEIVNVARLKVKYDNEWQRKFTLSAACLVMFFIGAPLGTIIRKGGFGMPVVVSVILYIIFHFLTITGEKFSKELVLTPIEGMWLGTAVLFPLGVFLSYKASIDSTLFNLDVYRLFFRRLSKPFMKKEKIPKKV